MSEETTQNLPNADLGLILAGLGSIDTKLDNVSNRLDRVDGRLDRVDQRLEGMDQRLDGMDQRLDGMDQRLEKLEARAYDTKPIWERALAEILEISKRLESLDRRFSVLTDDVIHTRADVRRLEERMANLEQPSRA